MGAVLIKILKITKLFPLFIVGFVKYNITKNKIINVEKEKEEDLFVEWGQFVEVDKPFNNHNRDKPL